MKPKQAATLLSNNQKYLSHLCIKGGKGGDFESVNRWFNILYPNATQLVNLIRTEKKDVLSYGSPLNGVASKGGQVSQNRGKLLFKALNIFKNGLYSYDKDVQLSCGMLFIQLIKEINAT